MNIEDLIRPYDPSQEVVEDVVLKRQKTSPFKFVEAVSATKIDIVDDQTPIDDYIPFIVNKAFGNFIDTVLYANELNMFPDMPKQAQYTYLMQSLRKRKRFAKWPKPDDAKTIALIRKVYKVRTEVAKQYSRLLSDEDIQKLESLTSTGQKAK